MTNKLKGSEDSAPWSTLVPTGPILRPAEAARYVGLSLATYYKHAARGLLPSPLKLGERAAGVPTNWLDAVIAKRATAAEAHA